MSVYTSLRDHFLIAMPTMADPHFSHSVIYICEHSPEGAMGIVVNMPLSIHLGDVLQNMNIKSEDNKLSETPVLAGGPIQQERGFVIHRGGNEKWESSLALTKSISITTSKDILFAIANHKGPRDMIIALGYAGWESGQLEREIAQNTWLCGPADPQVLFDIAPENRWRAAGALLGVDMDCLSTEVGHA
ncbi:MAG: YqgE/AlgH family protein [Gammaproteobacteria bacterium]|jgi:putative transcriptional regulator|nr:YqgE/AlgH family protein [Gammaproteobacteria bacterium]